MSYPRILTVQDISCVGQCSLTVALPVISACGVEACPIPSAVLSTHTAGFKGFTFRDLTDDIPLINDHWKRENIKFDALYTGYLGSAKQISYVIELMESALKAGGISVIDPAMADNGKLYLGFDMPYVEEIKKLCAKADYLLPNITEACLLTGIEYKTEYDRAYIDSLLDALSSLGCKNIVLTGVSYAKDATGVVIFENGEYHGEGTFYDDGEVLYDGEFADGLPHGEGTLYEDGEILYDFPFSFFRVM